MPHFSDRPRVQAAMERYHGSRQEQGVSRENQEADRLMGIVRKDLFLISGGQAGDIELLSDNVAANLKRLAAVIERGGLPDPFVHFQR